MPEPMRCAESQWTLLENVHTSNWSTLFPLLIIWSHIYCKFAFIAFLTRMAEKCATLLEIYRRQYTNRGVIHGCLITTGLIH
jgi:hypothetical protein